MRTRWREGANDLMKPRAAEVSDPKSKLSCERAVIKSPNRSLQAQGGWLRW